MRQSNLYVPISNDTKLNNSINIPGYEPDSALYENQSGGGMNAQRRISLGFRCQKAIPLAVFPVKAKRLTSPFHVATVAIAAIDIKIKRIQTFFRAGVTFTKQ